MNHEVLEQRNTGNMAGSQVPSERLITFPVAGVSEMIVPCDKLSAVQALESVTLSATS